MQLKCKKLIKGLFLKNGINNSGKKTCRYKGLGHKRSFRFINFFYNIWNLIGIIKKIEYDPNRNVYIYLITYQNGLFTYILGTYSLLIGNLIKLSNFNFIRLGNSLFLKKIPLGLKISQLQLYLNNKIKIQRAAGTFAIILKKINKYSVLSLKSLKKRLFLYNNISTIGRLSNIKNITFLNYKAGNSIWNNKKGHVRGIAMNPVDHPNGGNTPGKNYKSRWGFFFKGKKTRKKKKYSNVFLIKK